MSFHYWRNAGSREKRRFVTLANSYHGETLGALAVGDVELYKEIYRPLLMDVDHGALARLLRARARRELGGARAAQVRGDGGSARARTRTKSRR